MNFPKDNNYTQFTKISSYQKQKTSHSLHLLQSGHFFAKLFQQIVIVVTYDLDNVRK